MEMPSAVHWLNVCVVYKDLYQAKEWELSESWVGLKEKRSDGKSLRFKKLFFVVFLLFNQATFFDSKSNLKSFKCQLCLYFFESSRLWCLFFFLYFVNKNLSFVLENQLLFYSLFSSFNIKFIPLMVICCCCCCFICHCYLFFPSTQLLFIFQKNLNEIYFFSLVFSFPEDICCLLLQFFRARKREKERGKSFSTNFIFSVWSIELNWIESNLELLCY